MSVVCVWCGRVLRGRRTDPYVIHGLCGPCAAKQVLEVGLAPCFAPERREWDADWQDLGGEGGGA